MNPSTYTIKYGDTLSSIARNAGLSTQDIMRLNPTITDPNKIYAGRTLSLSATPATPTPAPTPAPVTTPTTPTTPTKPTIADVASKVTVPDYTEDPTLAALGSGYKTAATQTLDEEAIRKATRDRFQAQIDAVNQIYNQKKAEAKVQGTGRLGTTNAINARSGLLGSDFGAANTATTEQYNNDILNSIDSEMNAKIAAILTESDKDATAAIAEKRAAIEQGATKYLEYLGTSEAKKKASATALAKSLLAQGIDPSQLTKEQLDKISNNYGLTSDQFASLYTDAKTTADETKAKNDKLIADAEKAKASANQFELSDGQQKYVFDPKTGEAKLVATNAKEFAPNKYSAGGTGTGGGTSGGSTGGARGTGISDTGSTVRISDEAQLIIDEMNANGTALKDLLKGSPTHQAQIQKEVLAGLKAQSKDVANTVASGAKQAALQQVQDTIATLLKDNRAGSFRVRNADNKWLNPTANASTIFVANTQKLKDTLLGLDGPSIKSIFGPQISNSDIASIQKILASGLDPANQDPKAFEQSLKDIQTKLQLTGRVAAPTNNTPASSGKKVQVVNPRNGSVYSAPEENVSALLAKGWKLK